ncbi:distal tail protein Dit [Lysinibacillus xylanilyticus]|uniref:distal tail protein Dit n=1 Tax=Lysinibacillus xylanilyticus TaxID=582475 RepID=UPI003D02CFB6
MNESIVFTYDGISSEDMGVILISEGGGLFRDNFLPSRKIIEKSVAGRNTPYFKRLEEQPVSFPLEFYIEEWGNRENLREIARWLDQEYYKPLWFESNPNRVYYGLIEGSSELFHNGLKDGYVKTTVRCNSPYSYSHPITSKYTVSNELTNYINNDGDKPFRPYIKIKKKGNGDIRIKTFLENKLINNFQLNALLDGEEIDIDCSNEEIKSNFESKGRYLFDNHNNDWLEFGIGYKYNGETSTKMVLTGDFDIEMTYQYVYLTE